ncbi:carboxylesterase family protein [Streptomyces sp. NBC_01433]|uniref:carboxylesterase/lipase family protein n=1 Tax=Streptomyces sp. NBC_01433 TaxID=2903864 RepID=UPI0022549471|nr:carboxylesterase family protein [Streptomyces sp. NBC_01433]MCX4681159.1 carboxylesterase family protein [Streptomyces sp. NBC_01433]
MGSVLRRGRLLIAVTTGACLLLSAGALHASAPPEPVRPLTVQLDSGLIRGKENGAVNQYSGIRYAQPPVGGLRWKNPLPVRPWKGVADATRPGRICAQPDPAGNGALTGGEDCLFVNVTVPRSRAARPRPVMVWFHGGVYTAGAGSSYDPKRLASRGDVVVVTVNFRLGALGYLGLPHLPGSGNFGLADQMAALRWARNNAAAFGADPTNVTAFGTSSGGMSICAMLTAPAARHLFHKAAVQSGSCMLHWPPATTSRPEPYTALHKVEALGLAAAKDVGCPSGQELACLRAKPLSGLAPVIGRFGTLAYGTPLLPEHPAQALREGRFRPVPVLSGGNRDEGRTVSQDTGPGGKPPTAERYPALLRAAYGDRAAQVAALYPLSDYRSAQLAWATVITDSQWSCPTLTGDRLLARRTPVYAYEFADEHAPNIGGLPADLPPGAAHGSELPYLFDFFDASGWPHLTPAQKALAESMVDYWTAFAHTGNPNSPGAPAWPAFTRARTVISLAPGPDGIRPADYAAHHHCDFWPGLSR